MSAWSASRTRKTSSALMWRWVVFWKTSSTLIRGSVAFRPLFFSSSAWVMAVGRGTATRSAPVESSDHTSLANAPADARANVPTPSMPTSCVPRLGAAPALAGLVLAGCQSLQTSENFLGVLTPYRVEVVQGNVVTSEQIALVKPGQTRAQVRDVLGSPLLADPFHADRWDYVFTIRRQGAPAQLRRVVVRFKDDVLESVEGGAELPSEREFVASIDTFKTSRDAP